MLTRAEGRKETNIINVPKSSPRPVKQRGVINDEKTRLRRDINHLEVMLEHFKSCLKHYEKEPEAFKERSELNTIEEIDEGTSDDNTKPIAFLDKPVNELLYYFMGMSFSKVTEDCRIIDFHSASRFRYGQEYRLEIRKKEKSWCLGMWTMPGSLDPGIIMNKYRLGNDNQSWKEFLLAVKSTIDCFHIRKEQYNDLKRIIGHLSENSFVDSSSGNFSRLTLCISDVRYKKCGPYYNLTIYLNYRDNDALPCQVVVDLHRPSYATVDRYIEKDIEKSLIVNFKRQHLFEAYRRTFLCHSSKFYHWIIEEKLLNTKWSPGDVPNPFL